ncbi:hypothetical protein H8E88_35965 [candidate division KSB1 bacterium]|nr:hypothetical protein [candidate division KSB1 bacterium]
MSLIRMKNWYKNLEGRYFNFPADIQILNLVSDLKKADNLLTTQRTSAINHLYRAIILVDYIVEDKKWRTKLKELLRLKEAIGSFIYYEQSLASLDQVVKAALLLEKSAYKKLKI